MSHKTYILSSVFDNVSPRGIERSGRETDYLAVYVLKSAVDDILVFLSCTTVILRTWTKIGFMTWLEKHNVIFGT